MNILVSIITVVYNGELTIKDTIESVLNQTYRNLEYIIIDGKSTDNTIDIVMSYVRKFENKGIKFKIISEKDNGIYDAMNKGIDNSHGEIIGLINADDWYELDAIEDVVKCYKQNNFDMMYADLRVYLLNGNSKIKHAKKRRYITSRDWNHPTTFITRELYKQYRYKCESIYDDFDLMIRIRQSNAKIIILNKIIANFRMGGISNKTSIKALWNRIKTRYKIYRNNGLNGFYIFECIGLECAKIFLK